MLDGEPELLWDAHCTMIAFIFRLYCCWWFGREAFRIGITAKCVGVVNWWWRFLGAMAVSGVLGLMGAALQDSRTTISQQWEELVIGMLAVLFMALPIAAVCWMVGKHKRPNHIKQAPAALDPIVHLSNDGLRSGPFTGGTREGCSMKPNNKSTTGLLAIVCTLAVVAVVASIYSSWNKTNKLVIQSSEVFFNLQAKNPNDCAECQIYLHNPSRSPVASRVLLEAVPDLTRINPVFLEAWWNSSFRQTDVQSMTNGGSSGDTEIKRIFVAFDAARQRGDTGIADEELVLKKVATTSSLKFGFFVDVKLEAGQGGYFRAVLQVPQEVCKHPMSIRLQ